MPFNPIDIAGQMVLPQPVSAFIQGKMMAMTMQQERQQADFLKMQMADYPKQQAFEREYRERSLALEESKIAHERRNEVLLGHRATMQRILLAEDPVQAGIEAQRAIGADMGIRTNTDPEQVKAKARTYLTRLEAQGIGQDTDFKPAYQYQMDENGNVFSFDQRTGKAAPVIDPRTGKQMRGQKSLEALLLAEQAATAGVSMRAQLETAIAANEKQWSLIGARERLIRLREKVMAADYASPLDVLKQFWSADVQELRGYYQSQVLDTIVGFKQKGGTFGQTSDRDIMIVVEQGPQLGNRREANIALLNRMIANIDSDLMIIEERNKSMKFPDWVRPAPAYGDIVGGGALQIHNDPNWKPPPDEFEGAEARKVE